MQYRVVAADAFSTQRQHLWDLCYRITGSVADADMLLRECYAKAVERPVGDRDSDWRPHLVRSAATLAMETLRHRKRKQYVGCWLPSPVETGNASSPGPRPDAAADGARYDMVESGSIAFLRALEALEPRERVVLVMCDAFGVHPQETAAALELTSATARSVLQGARRRMQTYDSTQEPPTAAVQADFTDCLRDCLSHLQRLDASRLEKMMALDAQAIFDSGGEFVAPPGSISISGAGTIAKVLTKFADGTGPASFAFRMLNGLPAALGQTKGRPRWAKRFVVRIETREGLISEVQVILATAKLTAVRFDPL
jgi:RNA polymerase sigma-70 factor (ECF subfamily)